MADNQVQVSAQVDPGLKERLEARAELEERPVGTIVRRALERYLDTSYREVIESNERVVEQVDTPA